MTGDIPEHSVQSDLAQSLIIEENSILGLYCCQVKNLGHGKRVGDASLPYICRSVIAAYNSNTLCEVYASMDESIKRRILPGVLFQMSASSIDLM